jgi:hypothetical protein
LGGGKRPRLEGCYPAEFPVGARRSWPESTHALAWRSFYHVVRPRRGITAPPRALTDKGQKAGLLGVGEEAEVGGVLPCGNSRWGLDDRGRNLRTLWRGVCITSCAPIGQLAHPRGLLLGRGQNVRRLAMGKIAGGGGRCHKRKCPRIIRVVSIIRVIRGPFDPNGQMKKKGTPLPVSRETPLPVYACVLVFL